jgi:hypothetical protein
VSNVRHSYTIAEVKEPRSRPQTFGRGRVCQVDGCGTLLSIYNPAPFCAVHSRCLRLTDAVAPAVTKPVIEVRCAYTGCGASFLTRNPRRVYCSDRCRHAAFELRHHGERRAA